MFSPTHDAPSIVPSFLYELLEFQAVKTPHKVALEYHPDVQLTYSELNETTDRLARYLLDRQPQNADVIALCVDKTHKLVIAVLAILKANLTWLPLPLDAPSTRITSILQSCDVGLILHSETTEKSVASLSGCINLDRILDNPGISDLPFSNLPDIHRDLHKVCHVLFTSGSTGVPKGVVLRHSAVIHNVLALVKTFALPEDTRIFQFAAPTFDIFGLDLFMSFASGGCLVMAPLSIVTEGISEFMHRAKITYAQLTPTILRLLHPDKLPHLRHLISSGEALPPELAKKWRGPIKFFNAYGPTETIVCATQELNKDEIDSSIIGKAIEGLDIRLCNIEDGSEVPQGDVGEICVAGPQLLDRYISIQEGISVPEYLHNGQRYYRTGDLGRLETLHTGEEGFRYIGRIDDQVKYHGIRLHLGDIEHAVLQCQLVKHTASILPRRGSSAGRLCSIMVLDLPQSGHAKVVQTPDSTIEDLPASAEIASALGEIKFSVATRLPTTMLPTVWWVIREMPLTVSGKINRAKLMGWMEEMDQRGFDDRLKYSSHRLRQGGEQTISKSEQLLRSLWAEVLDRPVTFIDINLSFVEQGADSLDIIRFLEAARTAGVSLSFSEILSTKSIQELARFTDDKKASQNSHTTSAYACFSLLPSIKLLAPVLADFAEMCSVSVRDIEDAYPCTPYQVGLMLLDLKCPNSYVCNFSWTLFSGIDIDRFKAAFDELVNTEPVLRNRLIWNVGVQDFWQITVQRSPSPWCQEFFDSAMSLGHSLCRGFVHWDENAERWTFRLRIHHSIIDGWSLRLMLNRLRALYNAEKRTPLLAAAFPHFMRYRVEEDERQKLACEEFWTNNLDGFTMQSFPFRPTDSSHESHASDHSSLPVFLICKDLAARYRVTAATLLHAVTFIVLSAYSESDDVVTSIILAGRDAPLSGITQMIGPAFTNIPLRTKVNGEMTLGLFLETVEQRLTDIIPYQHYGLRKIKDCGPGARNACESKILVVVQPEDESLAGEGLWEKVNGQTTGLADSFPLSLELVMGAEKVLINCNFDPVMIPRESVTTLQDHICSVLLSLSHLTPDSLVSKVGFSDEKRSNHAMVWEEKSGYAVDCCLHDLVEQAVDRNPEQIAIMEQVTHQVIKYRELKMLAWTLSGYLQTKLVNTRNMIMPIAMGKSTLAILTILAVLRTGGVYVPIDPSWPSQRARRVLDDSGATVIICSPREAELYHDFPQKLVLLREENCYTSSTDSLATTIQVSVVPSDLAVVMYTSGSSGSPKGVMLDHRALSTSLTHLTRTFALKRGGRHLQFSSFVYDVSIADIFIPLSSGACICLPTEHHRLNCLSTTIRDMSIQSAILTPSVVELIDPNHATTLEVLMTGGEMTRRSLIRTWAPRLRLINAYGPTEASITTTMTNQLSADADPSLIGQSVTGWHWIVRKNSKGEVYPAPIGCAGEIAITGHALARGYMGNASLTEQQFLHLPHLAFGSLQGRTYLTGDVGCYESDGQIRIIGRSDRMVKINGIRVEPGEAEHSLRMLGGAFATSVVQCISWPRGENKLIAFIEVEPSVPSDTVSNKVEILKGPTPMFQETCQAAHDHLRHVLPSRSVPSLFVPVKQFLHTSSGKLNLKSLEEQLRRIPNASVLFGVKRGPESTLGGGDPSTPPEIAIESMFREIFALSEPLKTAADFFHQGGDSFTAIKLVHGVRHRGFEITVDQVYNYSTIGSLASVAIPATTKQSSFVVEESQSRLLWFRSIPESLLQEASESCETSIHDIEDIYPASHFQEGLAAVAFKEDQAYDGVSHNTYHAKITYRLAPKTDAARLDNIIQSIVKQNPIYRTKLISTSEGILQLVMSYKAEKLTRGSAIGQFSYDIHKDTYGYAHRLKFRIHHALYDASTFSRLLDDIDHFYTSSSSNRAPLKPYRQFIEYQSSLDQEKAKIYWVNYLRGFSVTRFPELPTNHYQAQSTQSMEDNISLDLEHLRAGGITVATAVTTGLGLLLAAYCNCKDVCYGITLSGRDNPDLEDIAGPTMSTLPLRMLIDDKLMTNHLKDTQRNLLDMRQYQHYGLQNIARSLDSPKSDSLSFHTLLVIQQSLQQSKLDQEKIVRERIEEATSMYTNYPLVVVAQEIASTGRLKMRFEYDPACLQDVQVRRFMRQLEQTITQCTQLNKSTTAVQMLTKADSTDIMIWNRKTPRISPQSILHIFEEKAVTQPELPAIITTDMIRKGSHISYRELNAHATKLAEVLKSYASMPPPFGICFDKSPMIVVAMLAIWKLGRTFVTLDPKAPASRLQSILADIGRDTIVLTQDSRAHLFNPVQTIILDTVSMSFMPNDRKDKVIRHISSGPSQPTKSDTAYVMYTSGSSGSPKGVAISHSAIATSLLDVASVMGLCQQTRMLQYAAFTFDTSMLETFGTLITGGCICMPEDAQRQAGEICTVTRQMQVNYMILTPTVAQFVNPQECPSVRSVMLVGERPSRKLLELWATEQPTVHLLNGYGPTEAAVHTTTNLNLSAENANSIGRATVCNVYLTKPADITQLAPIGTVGEIIICGSTLADGYLNQPELTSFSFGEELPWMAEFGATSVRYYRTGDLARYAPDGSLVYLGRKDSQIKLHGQRVELSEIEMHVKSSDHISECVVEVFATNVLVAFVAMIEPHQNNGGDLRPHRLPQDISRDVRRCLLNQLPAYMIPAVFVPVNRWPLTVSGKLDRLRLRQLADGVIDDYRGEGEAIHRHPCTEMQRAVAKVWAEALNIPEEQISIDHTISVLGGDSVTIIRIISGFRKVNISLTVDEIYQDHTLEKLAQNFESRQRSKEHTEEPLPPFSLMGFTDRHELVRNVAEACNVSEQSISDVYPCTSMQEALMIASTKAPGAFFIQSVYKLVPETELERLVASLQRVWRRHEILRTRIIHDKNYSSLQVVVDESLEVPLLNQDIETCLSQDVSIESSYGDVLCRCTLVNSNDRDRYLVISQHHAVFDGWSIKLLHADIEDEYCMSPSLRWAPRAFPIFVESVLKVSRSSEAGQYWMEHLRGFEPVSAPQIKASIRFQANQRHTLRTTLPTNARNTLAMIAEGAWGILLGRYTEAEDLAFGTVRSGRTATEGVDSVLGPTIVTVPRRLRPLRNQTVKDYLSNVDAVIKKGARWEQFGCQNIRKLSDNARQACMFSSIIVVQMLASRNSQSAKGTLIPTPREGEMIRSDCLTIECQPEPNNRLLISVSFDNRVMSPDDVQWIAHHYSRILSEISVPGNKNLHELDLGGSYGIRQAHQWNHSFIAPCNQRVESLFVKRSQQWPSSMAIDAVDAKLTYERLNEITSDMAGKLSLVGIKKGDIVPLLMSKSATMIVVMIAVLKIGAAYAPLDLDFPLERIRLLLKELNATYVVCTSQSRSRLSSLLYRLISCDLTSVFADDPQRSYVSASSNTSLLSNTDLAYVLFTSGSSGTPKGVLVSHTALTTTMLENGRLMEYTKGTRTLSFASYTFDVNVLEIYLTLLNGGCLFIPSQNQRLGDLSGYIKEKQIEVAFLTPTAVQRLLGTPSQVPCLKLLRVGGEPLTQRILQTWSPHVQLINSYGPTETCVDACRNANITQSTDPSNIGHPIGTHLWVVEPSNYHQLSPVGCPGELLISGPTLAIGYLNNQEATLRAFVDGTTFPWALPNENRFYVTGDIVRRNADGSISFLGRKDFQTKINGIRIEMGEVETALTQCEGIAVAIAERAQLQWLDSETLLAFFIPDSKTSADNQELLLPPSEAALTLIQGVYAKLRAQLPSYMVPSVLLPIRELPLTQSGKVDRKALQQLVQQCPREIIIAYRSTVGENPPLDTTLQVVLQSLWGKVLNVEVAVIGLHSDFLALGGDSIAAIKLASMCREIGMPIYVNDILPQTTLAGMAAHIQNCQQISKHLPTSSRSANKQSELMGNSRELNTIAEACGLEAGEIENIYPCTPVQEAMIASTIRQPESYIARESFRLSSGIDLKRLRRAWELVYERTPILRTRICSVATGRGNRLLQVVCQRGCEWADASSRHEINDYKMGLGSPLIQFRIFSSAQDMMFQISKHHAIYDAFSAQMMWDDLSNAFLHLQLPPERPPYHRYVDFLECLDKDAMQANWAAYLRNYQGEPFPPLPQPEYIAKAVSKSRQTITTSLEGQRSCAFTFATIARAAWALHLSTRGRNFGSLRDVCFLSTMSGRTAPVEGLENMLGPTITTIPVRVAMDLDNSVLQYLQNIQKDAQSMIESEHFGLQNISRVSDSAFRACKSANLLVVHPTHLQNRSLPAGLIASDDAESDFVEPFGLIIECTLNSSQKTITLSASRDPSLLKAEATKHMLRQLSRLIEIIYDSVTSNSTLRSVIWDLVDDQEHRRLAKWNKKAQRQPSGSLHSLFEHSALRNPEPIAIEAHDGILRYGELNAAANALARKLRSDHNVQRGSFVPLLFEKSVHMVVAILGVLKAGAAYVPLGTDYPSSRITHILKEVEAKVIVLSASQSASHSFSIPTLVPCSTVGLDAPCQASLIVSTPDDVAYITYTSGSTGLPKGVVTEHGAAYTSVSENSLRYQHDRHGSTLRFFQFSSYTFDASVLDIFGTLMHGGCLCIPSEEERRRDAEGSLRNMEVTFADLTPTVANLIDPSRVPSLKGLAIGGELANTKLIKTWTHDNSPLETFVNSYGPTEAGIACAAGDLNNKSLPGHVGKAVGGSLWVVDQTNHNHLVPAPCVGELVVSGPTLARGYLNDRIKTNEKFVRGVPWLPQSTDNRIYKTGDIARFDLDGNVEILGRVEDGQIKMHGMRLEIGEIESIIQNCPHTCSIQRIAVAKVDMAGVDSLVAFLEQHADISTKADSMFGKPSQEFRILVGKVEDYLRDHLPEYMIPALWLPVVFWPLTASNKTDRRSLAAAFNSLPISDVYEFQDMLRHKVDDNKLESMSEKECIVRDVWIEVLRIGKERKIRPQDNFFRLGGNSLNTIMLISAFRRKNLHITAQEVFTLKTLRDMADRIRFEGDQSTLQGLPEKNVRDIPHIRRNKHINGDQNEQIEDTVSDSSGERLNSESSMHDRHTDANGEYPSSGDGQNSSQTSHSDSSNLAREMQLRRWWASVLSRAESSIAANDDFFDRGGDDLEVLNLSSFAERANCRLRRVDIYGFPRLSEMAKFVTSETGDREVSAIDASTLVARNLLSTRCQLSAQRDVRDILPASHTQLSFLVEGLKPCRAFYAWWFFEVGPFSSVTDIQKVCNLVASRHPILQTEFHLIRRKCYQIVVGSACDFQILFYDEFPQQMCANLTQATGDPVQFGRVLTRFRFMIDSKHGRRILAFGLSHAQYDGFSIPVILNDLRVVSAGRPLENHSGVDHSRFIQHSLELYNTETERFWKETLKGSQLTSISRNGGAGKTRPVMNQSIRRTVTLASSPTTEYSYSVIATLAWALVLYKISQTADITFGKLVSGRLADFEGAHNVIGPCINIIPIRVRVSESDQFRDLLDQVLAQQVATMPYEATPFDLIARQASWPLSTRFPTIFQYQNLPTSDIADNTHTAEDESWRLVGNATYGGGTLDHDGCWLIVWPEEQGRATFRFTYSAETLASEVAESVLDLFISMINLINSNLDGSIGSKLAINTRNEQDAHNDTSLNPNNNAVDPTLQSVPPTLNNPSYNSILEHIKTIWISTLNCMPSNSHHTSDNIQPSLTINETDSFFENLGGDSIAAAETASVCQTAGLNVSLQDMIEFPTLRQQTLLVLGELERPVREPLGLEFVVDHAFN